MISRAYDLDDRQTLIKSVWEFSLPLSSLLCYSMVTSIHFQSLQLSLRPGTLHPERYFLIKKNLLSGWKSTEARTPGSWSVMLSEKDLIKWGKCRTLVHRNLSLLVGRWEGGALTSCDDWWLSPRGRERFLLFQARIQPIKSHGLLVHGTAPAPPLQAPAASSSLWKLCGD